MKKVCVALALMLSCALLVSGAAFAADAKDQAKPKAPVAAKPKPITPEQRKAAEGYWKAAQISEMIQESMKRMSMRVPEAERANFKRDISDKLMGSGQIEKKTIEAAARVFSKAELEALSKFYASPEGRSSMEKMPGFMAQLSRIVQMELMGLMEKAKAEQQKKAEAEKAKQEKDAPKDKDKDTKKDK
jgi:hypothetical protein